MTEIRDPLTQRPPEPAEQLRHARRPQRNRRWERENPGRTYRIDPAIHQALHHVKSEVEEAGDFRTTIDLIAESIMLAGLEAWEKGEAQIQGYEINPQPRTRRRNHEGG